jgi:hypothetical protein
MQHGLGRIALECAGGEWRVGVSELPSWSTDKLLWIHRVLLRFSKKMFWSESRYDWRSVSLGVGPLLGLMTRFLVLYGDYYGLCSLGAPSLTRGRVSHLSEAFVMFSCRVRIFTSVYTLYTIRYVQYVQGLCQSRLCEADYALSYLSRAMTTASHLNGPRPDRRQV